MHDEILNVDGDVWENSLEHDVHPRTGLTSANITEGKNIEIEGLGMEFNVFVHQLRSEVLHLKKISATLEIQSKRVWNSEERAQPLCLSSISTRKPSIRLVRSFILFNYREIDCREAAKNWRSDLRLRHYLCLLACASRGFLRCRPTATMAGRLD